MLEDTKLPAPTGIDRLIVALKAAAGGGWLGLTAEGIHQILGTVYKTQAEQFIEGLAEGLKELEKTSLAVEDVFSNPKFYEAAFHAAQAAARTRIEEKREALRNAVINSALPGSPSAVLQQIFIGWVERLTPSHLKIFSIICDVDPQEDPNVHPWSDDGPTLDQVLQRKYPELGANRGLLLVICDDLESLGLILRPWQGGWLGAPMDQTKPTELAVDFLKFISAPEIR